MSDDIIWQVINHQFCSFKLKTTKDQNFCRNEYNVSGLCNRQSCPLANAKYATVRRIDGKIYLYMKTAERAHMPKKLWERVKLSRNYETALKQIDQHLPYWTNFMIHKCKQRMTRYFQVGIRERRERKKVYERELVGVAPKQRHKEKVRERKALVAARVEKAIEKELLDRLKSGAYGENPLNVEEDVWKKVLKSMQEENELEEDEMEEEEEEDDEDVGQVEFVEDEEEDEEVDMEDLERWLDGGDDDDDEASSSGESDDDDDDDDENASDSDAEKDKKPKKKRRTKGPRVEIEYEQENANDLQTNITW